MDRNKLSQKVLIFLRPGETGQQCLPNIIFPFKSGVTYLSTADDSETINSVCQAMLASFAKAFRDM